MRLLASSQVNVTTGIAVPVNFCASDASRHFTPSQATTLRRREQPTCLQIKCSQAGTTGCLCRLFARWSPSPVGSVLH